MYNSNPRNKTFFSFAIPINTQAGERFVFHGDLIVKCSAIDDQVTIDRIEYNGANVTTLFDHINREYPFNGFRTDLIELANKTFIDLQNSNYERATA